jgi:hypothetical protein
MGRKVRANFIGSARTYGAHRVWRDVLAEGVFCGLHRIERLMQAQAFRARGLAARPAEVQASVMEVKRELVARAGLRRRGCWRARAFCA